MLVVDASALLDGITTQNHPLSLLVRDHELAAPALIDLELAQTMRRAVRAGLLSPDEAYERLAFLTETPGLSRFEHSALVERIWELRDNFTAYDASYVALAEQLAATLVTTDLRLAEASRRHASCEVITPG